jgi:hypothetical protein
MSNPFEALRNRLRTAATPPAPTDTFQTLARPAEPLRKRVKSGRTEQFNVRVKAGFKARVEELATNDGDTIGAFLEKLLAIYESGAGAPREGVPVGEARFGRTRPIHLWATDDVCNAVGKVAAERKLTVSGLVEDLLAREVARLDPHGGKFGVDVKREGAR